MRTEIDTKKNKKDSGVFQLQGERKEEEKKKNDCRQQYNHL